MAKRRKFSDFLLAILIGFQALTLTLVVGVMYGYLSRNMNQRFHNALKVQEGEVSMLLQDRINAIESQLQEISMNDTVRMSLSMGLRSELFETIHAQQPAVEGVILTARDRSGPQFVPALPQRLAELKPV